MGLDISHIKLTKTPNKHNDFFYIDEWDTDCNVPIEVYEQYVTIIDDLKFDKIVAFVKTKEDYEKFRHADSFKLDDYSKVFIGDFDETMEKKLSQFVENQKIDNYERLHLNCEHNNVKYQIIAFGEPVKVQGVYYSDDVGYQRKGMDENFYPKFKKHMLWGKKEDFDFAYSCVGDDWYVEHFGQEDVDRMKKNFKENFVDKFEFGKSLLCLSW